MRRAGALTFALTQLACVPSAPDNPVPLPVDFVESQSVSLRGSTFSHGGFENRTLVGPQVTGGLLMGTPSSLKLRVRSVHASQSPSCSDAVLVGEHGDPVPEADFVLGQEIFRADPPAGAYHCFQIKIEDGVRFKVDEAGARAWPGTCAGSDSEHAMDLYPSGRSDFVDENGARIDGVDSSSETLVFFVSTDPSALPSGIAAEQKIRLSSPIIVPTTLYLSADARNRVTGSGNCALSGLALSLGGDPGPRASE